jgi:Protein of unknown function (DUF2975)
MSLTVDTRSSSARERIRVIASMTRYLIAAIAAVTAVAAFYLFFLAVFAPAQFDPLVTEAMDIHVPHSITPPVRLALTLLVLAGIGLFFWVLRELWLGFSAFRRGEVFAAATGLLLRRAGYASLANAIYLLALPVLATLLATINNPQGQKALAIGFNTQQALSLLMAGILVAVGHVISLAAEIDEDNRSIV